MHVCATRGLRRCAVQGRGAAKAWLVVTKDHGCELRVRRTSRAFRKEGWHFCGASHARWCPAGALGGIKKFILSN